MTYITRFKITTTSQKASIDVDSFQKFLGDDFTVSNEVDGLYVGIESGQEEDVQCQYLIDRELDRYFFLTSVRASAYMRRRVVSTSVTIKYNIGKKLPSNIGPQNWGQELGLQLRLWALASDANDFVLQIILYFQIIELSFPAKASYPEYKNFSTAPHPLTECKYLRHLAGC